MHERGLAHYARRRGDATGEAHLDFSQFGVRRFQHFSGWLFAFSNFRFISFETRDNRSDRVFTRGSVSDVAALEFVRIDVADQRAQRLKVSAARDSLIVFFEKRHRHGNSRIVNGKASIDKTRILSVSVNSLCLSGEGLSA